MIGVDDALSEREVGILEGCGGAVDGLGGCLRLQYQRLGKFSHFLTELFAHSFSLDQ